MLFTRTRACCCCAFFFFLITTKSNDFHSTDLIWIYGRMNRRFIFIFPSVRHLKPQAAKEQSAFSSLSLPLPLERAQNNLITQCRHERPLPHRVSHNMTTSWKSTKTIRNHNKGRRITVLKYVDNTQPHNMNRNGDIKCYTVVFSSIQKLLSFSAL